MYTHKTKVISHVKYLNKLDGAKRSGTEPSQIKVGKDRPDRYQNHAELFDQTEIKLNFYSAN